MFKLAITGGLGSGKSTVRELFQRKGCRGIDADELARRVVEPGTEGLARVAAAFGRKFLDVQGRLRRKALAAKVFSDPAARKKLESILHPLIAAEEDRLLEAMGKEDPDSIVVLEVPLVAEKNLASRYDAVLLVTAPREARIRRLMEAGRYTPGEADSRIHSQAADRERKAAADFVVDNGGDWEETVRQADRVLETIRSQAEGKRRRK